MSGARTIVLGASHWHVPLYAATIAEVHEVVGLSDDDPERVRDLAQLWGRPVDADWCRALIERRIPFVVEKPLGTSLRQLQEVRRAAEDAGVPAAVPLIQRGGPADS